MDGYEIGGEEVDPFDQSALTSAARRRLASMRRPVGIEPDAMDIAGNTLGGALAGAGSGAALGTAVGGPAGSAIGAGIGGLIGAFQGFTKRK